VRLGAERRREGEIADIRLLARRSVRRRLRRGRLPNVTILLSVKSIASCWSYVLVELKSLLFRNVQGRAFVTPKFSIVGIL